MPYHSIYLHREYSLCYWAVTSDFQQCCIWTCVYSDEPVQPPFKFRNCKLWSVSSLTRIEYSNDWQRLWSDCAYAQADLRLCWSHIPHCWKSHVAAQLCVITSCWKDSRTAWRLYSKSIMAKHKQKGHQCRKKCNYVVCEQQMRWPACASAQSD